MPQLDELTRTPDRRMGRRGLLRTFALGGAGIATAAILGCTDDDAGAEDDEMMEESMTPTAEMTSEAMADESMTPTAEMTGTAMAATT